MREIARRQSNVAAPTLQQPTPEDEEDRQRILAIDQVTVVSEDEIGTEDAWRNGRPVRATSGGAHDNGEDRSFVEDSVQDEDESIETLTFGNDEERKRNAFNFCLINARSLL